LIGALAARWWGERAGLSAAAVFGISSASPVLEGFTANGELLMAAPVALSVLLAERRQAFLAGLSAALAATIKPTALPSALAAVVSTGAKPSQLRNFTGGLLLGLGIAAAHGIATDARTYVYSVLGFRLKAHSAVAQRADLLEAVSWSLPEPAGSVACRRP